MAGTWDFCPDRIVPETLPPDRPTTVVSMNGWEFTAKPKVPYRRRFKLTLHGLRWYLNADGTFNSTTNPTFNARRLELFYQSNETWDSFTFPHPHFGNITCRFANPVNIPKALENANGLIEALEVTLVEHNPAYA